jgi:hypothetical protein
MQKGKKEISAARQLNKYSFMLEKKGVNYYDTIVARFFFQNKKEKIK